MRRELRLRDSRDFNRVYALGSTTDNKYLVLYYLYQDSAEPTKVGFSISKKIGPAVARNKLKRQLSALIYRHFEKLKPGYLIILVVKRAARELDFQGLERATLALLSKSGVLGSAAG